MDDIPPIIAADKHLTLFWLMSRPEFKRCMETARSTRERIAYEILLKKDS